MANGMAFAFYFHGPVTARLYTPSQIEAMLNCY